MLFEVQNLNQVRNNSFITLKKYKNIIIFIYVFMFTYISYFYIKLINKLITDKKYKQKIKKRVLSNLPLKLLVISLFILVVYYVNFVLYKYDKKLIDKYLQHYILTIAFPVFLLFNLIIYFLIFN